MRLSAPQLRIAAHRARCARGNGYVLLEIIIALTVFAVVATGLANALQSTLDSANSLRRQTAIRRGLEAILLEAKQKPKREEMILAAKDEILGIEYRTELEELRWVDRKGRPVNGLYVLRALATDQRPSRPQHDTAEIYIYRP